MTDVQFFQTRIGATYYEHTIPELVRQLDRLNANLERLVEAVTQNQETTGLSDHPTDSEHDDQEENPPHA